MNPKTKIPEVIFRPGRGFENGVLVTGFIFQGRHREETKPGVFTPRCSIWESESDINALENLTASHTADILTKLDKINDGDLTIAKTDGLLTALNSTAKLDWQIRLQDYKL